MSTAEKPPAKPETMTDLDYAIHLIMTGQRDPEFADRVEAETAQITEEVRSKHGVLNTAVELIREVPDEA